MTDVAVSTTRKHHGSLLWAQIGALTKKNFILSRRSKLTVCCEILLPLIVAIAALLIPPFANTNGNVLKTMPAADNPVNPGGSGPDLRVGTTSYADEARQLYSSLSLSGLVPYSTFFRQSNLILLVDKCLCGTLAIGPSGSQRAEAFASYLRGRIGAAGSVGTCGGAPLLSLTTSISDPSAYVKSPAYGSDSHPEICYYMDVGKENEVTIRSNATTGASDDYSDYTRYWYAENGDYQHGDPIDNGLDYYDTLDFPLLMATWMDYLRSSDVPVAALYPMPYPSYKERGSGGTMKQLSGIVGALLFTFSAFSVSRKLISERRGRLREGMRIMGLHDLPYNLSWYAWYFVFYFVLAIAVALLSLGILSPFGALWLFLLTFLYFYASMAFAFSVSTLFKYPNSGSTLTAVIYYILSFVLVAVHRETDKWAVSLLPQCAYTLVMQNLGQQVFLGLANPSSTLKFEEFNLIQGLIMLLVDIVLWTAVYLYLDQVVPHEYRSSRKFYFLFTRSFWREMRGQNISDDGETQGSSDQSSEERTSSNDERQYGIEKVSGEYQKELEREQATIGIHDLRVHFKSVRAVDGLDLTMYRDELFVLLGHNGAGKSTTINVLSTGYTLSIAKKDSKVPDEPLVKVVQKSIDDPSSVRVRSSAGQELSLQVPYSCASSFPKIFEGLEDCKSADQITSYGISISSMEDVFLNVARRSSPSSDSIGKGLGDDAYEIELKPTFSQQVRGLLMRRLVYAYRNWVGTLAALLIPMVVLLVLLGFQKTAVSIGDATSLTLRPSSNPYKAGPSQHIVAQWSTVDPFVVTVARNGQPLPSIDASLPLTNAEVHACSLLKPYDAIPYEPNTPPNSTLNNALCAGILRFSASLLGEDTAWFEVTALGVTSRSVFADMTALHMTPFALAGNQPLTVVNHPLPHTASQFSNSLTNFAVTFSVGGFYAIALTVVASTLLSYMMMEKTTKIKEQLYVSGCGLLPYWTASWVFDFLFSLIAVCLTFIPLRVYEVNTYLQPDNQAAVWALLVGFCFATPPFNYLISVVARTSTIATYMRIASSILGGLVGSFAISVLFFARISPLAGLILMWIVRVFPTYSVAQGLTTIFFTGLQNTGAGSFTPKPFDSQILRTCHDTTVFDINGNPFNVCAFVAGDDVIMLFVYGVIYFGLLLFLDYKLNDDKWNPDRDLAVPPEKCGVEDERVIAEKERVSKLDPTTQMIYFKDLKKVFYPGKDSEVWAVRGINYALADGGVFGLLGVNGAGKTTTFRMLCGLIRPSAGHINLVGRPLQGNVYEVRKSVGYCPQQSPLLQGLTAKDHLYLYARIRGVPSNRISQHVDDLVKILQLERYIDKEAVKLSGGNQRKLCVGMALVGHPPIVFLDEPTTGVDPGARRRIWDVIHKIAHDRSKTYTAVILTTHSMEEADAVCETMVIQVDGQFRCIGTSQQIKSDYGRGYRLWIHFRDASEENKQRAMKQILAAEDAETSAHGEYVTLTDTHLTAQLTRLGISEQRLIDSVLTAGTLDETFNRTFNRGALASAAARALQHMNALQWLMQHVSPETRTLEEVGEFALPRDIDLGSIFSELSDADAKEELEMHDFQLSQTTLEQIFNTFARGDSGGKFRPNCAALQGKVFPVYDREAMLQFIPHHAMVHKDGDEMRVIHPGKLSILFMMKARDSVGQLLGKGTYDRSSKYLFHLSPGQVGDIIACNRLNLILNGDYNQKDARVHFRLHERYYREVTLERSGHRDLITVMMPEPAFFAVRTMLKAVLPSFYGWDLLLHDVTVQPDRFIEKLEEENAMDRGGEAEETPRRGD
ncbi:hypothetical protein FOZ61_001242 [Perkinsus olseni]|uniref:ABC transporter domain-containing protein n=1 Tax=Perkinsus olseni TaxID=32597 RepID=A0A7J6MFK3_PEROL|nr:hypothetical protein FOZ61_001242 [Perkinsus olseni]